VPVPFYDFLSFDSDYLIPPARLEETLPSKEVLRLDTRWRDVGLWTNRTELFPSRPHEDCLHQEFQRWSPRAWLWRSLMAYDRQRGLSYTATRKKP
jgi:hypothetical protein